MLRKGLICAAAAVMALGSIARAENSTPSSDSSAARSPLDFTQASLVPVYGDDVAPTAPAPAAPAAAPAEGAAPARAPLMAGLDQIGIGKTMDDMHLNIGGFVEGGYLYDFTVPRDVTPAKSAPGDNIFFPGPYKNSPMLNQVDLNISRTVDASKGQWDVGFKVEGIYGRDAFFTHSNGILDNNNKHGGGPDDQLDLVQAYITAAIPVGSGLTLQAGKFVTPLGNETIDPTQNALYTHSYIFSFGIPFTQTGILGSYNITDSIKVTAGATRGWNQSTLDNNGSADFLGSIAWTVNSKLSLTGNLSVGPESFHDVKDYWTVPEVIAAYQVSDQLKISLDGLYGDASSIAQWYALAGYADYTFNKYLTLNLRGEFYHDGRGFTTGFGGSDINYEEATAGVAVTPVPDIPLLQTLTVRPEVRGDFADHSVFDGSKFTQLTAAVDVFWKF